MDEKVRYRLRACIEYVHMMERERNGYGPDAYRQVDASKTSLLNAVYTMMAADRLWVEGPGDLSFGGTLNEGTLQFGVVARYREPDPAVYGEPFDYRQVEWTVHS